LPSFGLNYDPSHFILQDMAPLSPLAKFKSKLFHLHAKDVKINHAALSEVGRFDFPLRWQQPRIPGYGDIHWAAFMAELMRKWLRVMKPASLNSPTKFTVFIAT
jgi:sugar phosphate isomerase/epimerase